MGARAVVPPLGGSTQPPDNTDPNEAVQKLVARSGFAAPLVARMLARRAKPRRAGSLERAPVNDAASDSEMFSRARTAAARAGRGSIVTGSGY